MNYLLLFAAVLSIIIGVSFAKVLFLWFDYLSNPKTFLKRRKINRKKPIELEFYM